MRIDKFLNGVNITKRRSVAQDMLKSGAVYLNGVSTKPAKEVKVGDKIELKYLDGRVDSYKVIEIPKTKTTPKSQQSNYIEVV